MASTEVALKPSVDRQLLCSAREGVVAMIRARGRKIQNDMADLYLDEAEVERRVRGNVPELLDFLFEEEGMESIYVWFAHYAGGPRGSAVNLAALRQIVADVQKRCAETESLRIILILREEDRAGSVRALEEQMRKDDATFRGRVELFTQRDVIMPVVGHMIQPKITVLNPQQREALKRDLHVDPIKDLARMRDHDKLVRYLAIPKNSVVRIDRPDGTVGYRLVE